MARQPRVDVANFPYHVINRAVGRLRIFKSDKDYQLFVDLLTQAKVKTGMRVLAFEVMPNHWHLILWPENAGDIKKFMHLLTNAHTRKVHAITNTIGTGPLYQGRYKSFIIKDDLHLLTVLKYVERNAVRAGLARSVEAWKWGSGWIRKYGTPKQKGLLTEGPAPLPRNYNVWVNTPEKENILEQLRTSTNKGTPFGDSDWVQFMVKKHDMGATMRGVGRPKGSGNK